MSKEQELAEQLASIIKEMGEKRAANFHSFTDREGTIAFFGVTSDAPERLARLIYAQEYKNEDVGSREELKLLLDYVALVIKNQESLRLLQAALQRRQPQEEEKTSEEDSGAESFFCKDCGAPITVCSCK